MQIIPKAAPETSRSDWQKAAESVARNFSTTEEYAAALKVKPQSVRAGYCRDGHYLGVVPIKPSRRLLWPADQVDALIAGQTVKADAAKIDEHFARKAADASKVPAHLPAKAEKRLTSGEGAK